MRFSFSKSEENYFFFRDFECLQTDVTGAQPHRRFTNRPAFRFSLFAKRTIAASTFLFKSFCKSKSSNISNRRQKFDPESKLEANSAKFSRCNNFKSAGNKNAELVRFLATARRLPNIATFRQTTRRSIY